MAEEFKNAIESHGTLEKLKEALEKHLKTYAATCPDQSCMAQIYFPSQADSVTCHKCLQTHSVKVLLNIYETDEENQQVREIIEFGPDFVKVEGLSNFHCKLLSPFLTKYGMNKFGSAVLLKDLGHSETIDCGKVLGSRSFAMLKDHIDIIGYGKDRSGSLDYLSGFLAALKDYHNGEERLVPIHVDGDGHCLVHALSRALTGRELFWHGLRQNLYDHLKQRLSDYTTMFQDFHSKEEWDCIIAEADPNCTSSDGITVGLGNIHIFALSNILKRPILLLDSLQKMQSRADYSGLFVPAFVDARECINKSPICIAWSGAAHNHFVPLVSVAGLSLPTIPNGLIPNLWAVSPEVGRNYLSYNGDGSLTVCDGKPITVRYIQRLASAMESVFLQQHVVSPTLVEHHCRFNYRLSDTPGLQPRDLITTTAKAALENRLFRCLNCDSLREVHLDEEILKPGGKLYNLVIDCHTCLLPDKLYDFPLFNVKCIYHPATDRLELYTCRCNFCARHDSRPVDVEGRTRYRNGDKTEARSATGGRKVFWDGKEYDNEPDTFTLTIDENEREVKVPVVWFYGNSDPDLNSDVKTEAKRIASTHFNDQVDDSDVVERIARNLSEKCSQKQQQNTQKRTHSHPGLELDAKSTDEIPTSSVSSGEKSSSSQHQPAFKRKSNGEPTDSCASLKHVEQKSVVKISLKGGGTKTVRVHPLIDMSGLQTLVKELFGVEPEQQILKQGFPPKVLEEPSDGGSLGLKSGDKITVVVKAEPREVASPAQCSTSTAGTLSTPESRHELLLRNFRQSKCATLWEYAMDKPELFHTGGYFYEKFKTDIGLSDGQHCRFPLLENLAFCYNKESDRVELCLEPDMAHYPIDDNIRRQFKKFTDLTCDRKSPGSVPESITPSGRVDSPVESTEEDSHVTKASRPKSLNLAPGYHTLGEKPTELSENEKLAQKNSLLKMVEKLKSEQSSLQ